MASNKDYLSAVGKPNVASRPSADTMQRTMDTAKGPATARSSGAQVRTSPVSAARSQPRGSWEGYMAAPSTQLHANGTGYERNPKARGYKPTTALPKFANSSHIKGTKFNSGVSNLTNRSLSSTSSMSRLSNLMKLNKLF